ncbi:MAG TPA: N-acetyltransferase [Pseudomonadales bacterium]
MARSATRRIRPAGPADLDAIVAIETAAFEPPRRSTRRALRRALESSFQRTLVLEAPDAEGLCRIAGYVVIWPFPRTWRIYNLAADPSWGPQGFGSALLAAAVEEASRAGARRLVLEARPEPRLLRFYEQRGLRRVRELPDYYAPGEPALRLEMRLPKRGAAD